jgi:prolyl oligopeptidase PreP (S9A serine peptidase family)
LRSLLIPQHQNNEKHHFHPNDYLLICLQKDSAPTGCSSERVALMGQSFGGYKTNFILTQTKLFRAAISGVSIFDL